MKPTDLWDSRARTAILYPGATGVRDVWREIRHLRRQRHQRLGKSPMRSARGQQRRG